jgi:hypothetical protein
MPQIIESIKAHYSTLKVPFGRVYSWHQAHVGADYGALVHDIHHREERQRDEDVHPWHYDAQSQAGQHLRDEAAYAEASPWRYNDVTSGLMGDDEERWKEARTRQLRTSFYAH